MFSVFLCVISVILLLFSYHWSRRNLYKCAAQFSGPKGYPLIGNGLDFLCDKKDIFKTITKITRTYSSPVRIWAGPKLVLFVTDADQLQQVVHSSKMSTKAFIYRFLEPFLGKGLFTSAGNVHRNHRRLFQPLFSHKHVEGYSHLFKKHAVNLADNLRVHAGGPEFDILGYLNETAFEATMDILFEDKNEHPVDYKDVPGYIRKFYEIFFARTVTVWQHFDPIFQLTGAYREQEKMRTLMHLMTQDMQKTRVAEVVTKLQDGHQSGTSYRTPSMLEILTEMLLDDPEALTIQECIDHMMTFVAAGQDTQSSALAFTCMMFGIYPDIQEKVYRELMLVLEEDKTLNYDQLSKLEYMEMCLKESLRLFTVAPFVFREAVEDFKLDKLTIPKGAVVGLSFYNVHTDPKHWSNPDKYHPGHFEEEQVKKRHPYAFLPFSAGSRRCIAQQYSYTNMKIVLSTLLQNYVFESKQKFDDIDLTMDISIRPVGGYLMKIKRRS